MIVAAEIHFSTTTGSALLCRSNDRKRRLGLPQFWAWAEARVPYVLGTINLRAV
jgi:hypothetical protein